MRFRRVIFAICCLIVASAPAPAATLEQSLDRLGVLLPQSAAAFDQAFHSELAELAGEIEEAAADVAFVPVDERPAHVLATARRLVSAKRQVDDHLEQLLALRKQFSARAPQSQQRLAVRSYLRATGTVIDLSGRLRYLLVDALSECAAELAPHPAARRQLVDDLIVARSTSGALVMSALLDDPPRDVPRARRPDASLRLKVLELMRSTAQEELLEPLARFVAKRDAEPALVIEAAEVIRHIGLPQDPTGDQDPKLPRPTITADELHSALTRLRLPRAQVDLARRRTALVSWLAERRGRGISDNAYRLAGSDVRPGDWLLMRNPSPYNLFTDLSPGLFTHVGVVALAHGADGKTRMVVVDVPERGRMPGTNIDTFVKRTRHYVIVRHDDPQIADKMGAIAGSLIGNETQFDLNFRTDRVFVLQGKPLAGAKIHTYCAGLLLLSALEAGAARGELFPVPEFPAGGHTLENLAKLGMSIGDDFISPTGALFSSRLEIVARREPMYEPRREIEEAIYDHFAEGMMHKTLVPAPDLYQALRLRVASAAKQNTLLQTALAAAAGLNQDMDLLAAAKAAAVIETLDEIAYGASSDFLKAQQSLRGGTVVQATSRAAGELTAIRAMQARHRDLYRLWNEGALEPRDLRMALVKYYVQRGRQQLNDRFFTPPLAAGDR